MLRVRHVAASGSARKGQVVLRMMTWQRLEGLPSSKSVCLAAGGGEGWCRRGGTVITALGEPGRKAGCQNGRMAKWQNGKMDEWHNARLAELQSNKNRKFIVDLFFIFFCVDQGAEYCRSGRIEGQAAERSIIGSSG